MELDISPDTDTPRERELWKYIESLKQEMEKYKKALEEIRRGETELTCVSPYMIARSALGDRKFPKS